ncbi:MAG TPA: FYDLN acid domain-containing protein [Thermoanaerobaculia bacterium]|jgi:hypothetical protein
MPELKLGIKYECYNCGTKFYDLGKGHALCPKCGADQKDSAQAESPSASQASRRRRKAEVAKALDIEEEEPIADIGEDELVEPEIAGDLGDEEEEEEEADDEE